MCVHVSFYGHLRLASSFGRVCAVCAAVCSDDEAFKETRSYVYARRSLIGMRTMPMRLYRGTWMCSMHVVGCEKISLWSLMPSDVIIAITIESIHAIFDCHLDRRNDQQPLNELMNYYSVQLLKNFQHVCRMGEVIIFGLPLHVITPNELFVCIFQLYSRCGHSTCAVCCVSFSKHMGISNCHLPLTRGSSDIVNK